MNAQTHKPIERMPKNHSLHLFDAGFALGLAAFSLVTFVPPLATYADAVYAVLIGCCLVSAVWLVIHWRKEWRNG